MSYTKKDYIKRLIEIGTRPELVRMPAIIEFLELKEISLDEIRVDVYGNIIIRGMQKVDIMKASMSGNISIIEIVSDTFNTKYSDIRIINEYGIEVSNGYQVDKDGQITSEDIVLERENGIVLYYPKGKNDLDCKKEYSDDGSALMQEPEYYKNLDGNKLSTIIAQNISYLLSNFPQTEEYFIEGGILPEDKEQRQEILSNNFRFLHESSEDLKSIYWEYTEKIALENRKSFFKQENDIIQNTLKQQADKISILIDFARKCYKIPVWGMRIKREMKTELAELVLEPQEEMDYDGVDTELVELYTKFLKFKELSQKNVSSYKTIKRILFRNCSKTPFLGKKLLEELQRYPFTERIFQDNVEISE